MKIAWTAALAIAIVVGTSVALVAQVAPADSIPNWSVPATWSPAGAGGIQTMTDVTSPRVFVGVSPCRIADTRASQGFSGQAGPPSLTSFNNRNFQITGSPATVPAPPAGCAAGTIPAGADAVSLQFTVVTPTSSGNLVAWQAGAAQPTVSVLNWDPGTVALGNGTIVPLSGAGAITVRLNTAAGGQGSDLVIDVNGYFSESAATASNFFEFENNTNIFTARFQNNSTTCVGACGVTVLVSSGNAIVGQALEANSDTNFGVLGTVYSTGAGSAGVMGQAFGTFGAKYGVVGKNSGDAQNSAGVLGESFVADVPSPNYNAASSNNAGVRGHGRTGVLGYTPNGAVGGAGVVGHRINPTTGVAITGSFLGYSDTVGLHTIGTTTATGAKGFVEPHPTDSSKMIRYVSLEGPEAGTYFRGRAKLERGTARIEVPEDFRLVTDTEGLTVQVTPIGAMATMAVLRMDLNEIVVQGSRNVDFSYLVQGVRRSYRDVQPIMANEAYIPRSPDERMADGYAPEQKRLLVQNGTYNADGTVNMENARRKGWDRIWAEAGGSRPAPLPE